jgi:succinyl-CoA synthetase beta subunit
MNLHEYQAKELLKKYDVPVQNGIACVSVEEALAAYKDISERTNSRFVVMKAQIHAGGRGKGTYIEVPTQHGVQVVKSEDMARESSNQYDWQYACDFANWSRRKKSKQNFYG